MAAPVPAPDAPSATTATLRHLGDRSARTQVVILGTGTPIPDPRRSGPCVAVVVDDVPYLVDMGPGLVRRASQAHLNGIAGLDPERLTRAFVTHLHSDHTVGYPDLIHTPWVVGRTEPLQVWGPPGLQSMTDHLVAAWAADRSVRVEGTENLPPRGGIVMVNEITEGGEIYRDERVTVTAIEVPHGTWSHAYGYRFDTPDRRIVISGDTAKSAAIAAACDGCDLLVHEVFSEKALEWIGDKGLRAYHGTFHTSTTELAELAAEARPARLVLYHQLFMGMPEDKLVDEVASRWQGDVMSARDLDVY